MTHVLTSPATSKQLAEMLSVFGREIKVAVDVSLEILAGRGELHADCEERLIAAGSDPENLWGATWSAATGEVTFWSVINYRPHLGQRSAEIADPKIRARVRISSGTFWRDDRDR